MHHSWSWAALKGQILYGISSKQFKLWETEKVNSLCKISEVTTELVGPVYDPMGQVYGGWIKIFAPKKAAIITSLSTEAWVDWAESQKVWLKYVGRKNENFLLLSEALNHSDPQAVGAIGHFDTVDAMKLEFRCILLTMSEGLIIS